VLPSSFATFRLGVKPMPLPPSNPSTCAHPAAPTTGSDIGCGVEVSMAISPRSPRRRK
jgi:hypothetical protein